MDDHSSSHGPVPTLPGSKHHFPEGSTCDTHPERPAAARIQGETDSFGCEYIHMCKECYDQYSAAREALGGASHFGSCRCGSEHVPLFVKRDWEEGTSGPVYYVCQSCLKEWNLREAQYFADNSEDLIETEDPYSDFQDDF